MDHWPGHEIKETTQTTEKAKGQGKQKADRLESSFWQWPHMEHGSIGRATLVSKAGRVQWSSVVDTLHDTRWLPVGRPTKVFPVTRSPQDDMFEPSARRRTEKGLQYLHTYFPDAEFPSELLGNTLESDAKETHLLKAFNPYLGNLLEIMPSYHSENESAVLFPMGELGRELTISHFSSDRSGNMIFKATGSPSFVFETPILQISSAIGPSEWISTPSSVLLIRTHTSSSLLRLEYSKVTREVDITRSEVGGAPVVDSRILASGPDIVVVNRSGRIYRCTAYHGGKVMQLIGLHEVNNDDNFWQLGITERNDECFLASCKAVKHIDLRSASSVVDVFSLDHPSAVVTSFESPKRDYISRVATTSNVVWLDDRFRRRPLLSFKHYRSFDRTLRVLTADLSGAPLSLLTSRRNGFVTLYDVSRGSDGLLHCGSMPSCLPHDGLMFTVYGGHALVALPSGMGLTFFRLCQRGSIHRQDIRAAGLDEGLRGSAQEGHDTHRWDGEVQRLERRANELQTDFGPAGGRHYTEVNLRGAYEEIFKITDDNKGGTDQVFGDTLAWLSDAWRDAEEGSEGMLTTLDVIRRVEDRDRNTSHTNLLAGGNINSKQAFDALTIRHPAIQKFAGLARWQYNIQDTSIPGHVYYSANCSALHEHLKGLDPVPGVGGYNPSVQRQTEAREQLVVDLALSNGVYYAGPGLFVPLHSSVTGEATSNTTTDPTEMTYSKEPPEVNFRYFRPVRKLGADHYTDKDRDREQESGISSPLGVRLLLAEWQLGTDPKDYTYCDPYGLEDTDGQPVPQYRGLPDALLVAQNRQGAPPKQPPLVVTAATQPPVIRPVEHALTTVLSQTAQHAHSQQFDPELNTFSQQPMASTQTLPGPYGGRPGAGKKPSKKRIGGF